MSGGLPPAKWGPLGKSLMSKETMTAPGLPRLKDGPHKVIVNGTLLRRTMVDPEKYIKEELFRRVNQACRDCSQVRVVIERSEMGQDTLARAACSGQPETVEMPPLHALKEGEDYGSALVSVVRRCPDEIRGKEITGMWHDELSDHHFDAMRGMSKNDWLALHMNGAMPEHVKSEPPKPEPKKYDQFGDW